MALSVEQPHVRIDDAVAGDHRRGHPDRHLGDPLRPASWNLTGGTFQATGIDPSTTQVALDAFHNAMATTPALSAAYAVTLENVGQPGAQDQITGLRHTSQQVPEPGSLPLLALAAALAVGTLRARRT